MATFTFTPSFSADLSEKPVIRTVKFGDGYEQRLAFGLNTQPKVWQLEFLNCTDAERDSLLSFLRARGSVESFDWTDPMNYAAKWVCDEWSTQMVNYNNNTINATFRQVFEP